MVRILTDTLIVVDHTSKTVSKMAPDRVLTSTKQERFFDRSRNLLTEVEAVHVCLPNPYLSNTELYQRMSNNWAE